MPKTFKGFSFNSDESMYFNQETASNNADNMMRDFRMREKFTEMGMFGFVSWQWINPLSKWIGDRKCLEVMAGRGWLSYALQQKGIDVKATDNHSWANNMANYHHWKETVTEVEELDAVEAVEKYGKDIDIVIMSWAYMDNTAFQVLKRLHEVNPKALLIYIGEGYSGCTADDEFFDHYDTALEESFYEHVAPQFESWEAINDRLYVGRYK